MSMIVLGGSTDVTTYVSLRLASTGAAATGLTITDLDLQYVRSGAAPAAKVDATALAATDSAHADNKAIEVDGTDQPGLYRVDWPDAAFAAGAREVILSVKHTTCLPADLRVTIDPLVVANSITAGAITAAAIATGAIDADAIADNAIDAGAIAADAITAAKLASDVSTEINAAVLAILGTPAGASMSADIAAIEGQTDDIGAAGAGLTAVPWNAAWDAEVQSGVDDALVARGLDHLVAASVAGADIADDSIIAKMVSKSATADWDSFVNTTDALEALRDNTGTAGVGLTAADDAVIAALSGVETKVDTIDGVVDSILADTGTDGVVVAAGSKTGYALTSAYDFAKGTTAMTEAYAANGVAPTPVQALFAIHQMLMQFAIASTTITVKKLDNSTTAFLVTLDDGTNPTSAVRT